MKIERNSGLRKAIRRGSAEEEVRKHRDRLTEAWKQIRKQRRRVDVSYDPLYCEVKIAFIIARKEIM